MSDSPAGGVGEVQSTSASTPPVPWQSEELGIAFFGLGRLREWHSSSEDRLVAGFLQSYYVLAGRTIAAAGARLVKLNGAEGLCGIPAPRMAQGVHALCEFGAAVRRLAREHGFDAHLNVQVHFGAVVCESAGKVTPGRHSKRPPSPVGRLPCTTGRVLSQAWRPPGAVRRPLFIAAEQPNSRQSKLSARLINDRRQ